MRALKQTGDTIVEVLIAIAIISTVLVAAWQTTTRNTAATQDTQEHTVALKLAESQLETLQQNISSFPSDGSSLCFVGGAPSTDDSQCTITPVPGVGYNVSLKKSTDGTNVYEAKVTWTGIRGQNNEVSLLYRPEGA